MDEDYTADEYGENTARMLEDDYEEFDETVLDPSYTDDEGLNPKSLAGYGTSLMLLAAGSGWQAIEQGEPAYSLIAAGSATAGTGMLGSAFHAYWNSG